MSWEAFLDVFHDQLHLGLELLEESLELVHVGLLLGPANAEAFRLIGLGDLGRGYQYALNKAGVHGDNTMWKWT